MAFIEVHLRPHNVPVLVNVDNIWGVLPECHDKTNPNKPTGWVLTTLTSMTDIPVMESYEDLSAALELALRQ